MKTIKRLKEVERINYNLGKKLYKKHKKKGGASTAKASISAFNVTIKAMRYRLLFRDK